ncbi:hypothetical protein C8J57DRAFT_1707230 [Mycena rebaudengoi]|nr:hypothetical protein C8J57DRAFT_1707230 [Mycena rebaudengoi]
MSMASLTSCAVYLGNIHPEPSTKDVQLDPRGRAAARAFITCIGPATNRRLKLGWGKDSGPRPRSHSPCTPARSSRGKNSGKTE